MDIYICGTFSLISSKSLRYKLQHVATLRPSQSYSIDYNLHCDRRHPDSLF